MNVYSIDVKIVGTAYIVAPDEETARRLFEENMGEHTGAEIREDGFLVTGKEYSTLVEDVKEEGEEGRVTISPAISFCGAFGTLEFEEVYNGA